MRLTLVLSCLFLTCGLFTGTGVSATNRAKPPVYTHDFITATRIVGKYYGRNVRDWLYNCSSSEGGHGEWVWFGRNSYAIFGTNTPGGWMQFMQSTFDHNVDWAFTSAAHRGLKVRPKARSYYEPLGQAIVAGAMYFYHGNPGTWTGGSC